NRNPVYICGILPSLPGPPQRSRRRFGRARVPGAWRRSSNLSSIVGQTVMKPFAGSEQDAVPSRNPEFETLCDPPCPFDEMRLRLGRANLPRGVLEQGKPTIEVGRIDRKRQMLGHWA